MMLRLLAYAIAQKDYERSDDAFLALRDRLYRIEHRLRPEFK